MSDPITRVKSEWEWEGEQVKSRCWINYGSVKDWRPPSRVGCWSPMIEGLEAAVGVALGALLAVGWYAAGRFGAANTDMRWWAVTATVGLAGMATLYLAPILVLSPWIGGMSEEGVMWLYNFLVLPAAAWGAATGPLQPVVQRQAMIDGELEPDRMAAERVADQRLEVARWARWGPLLDDGTASELSDGFQALMDALATSSDAERDSWRRTDRMSQELFYLLCTGILDDGAIISEKALPGGSVSEVRAALVHYTRCGFQYGFIAAEDAPRLKRIFRSLAFVDDRLAGSRLSELPSHERNRVRIAIHAADSLFDELIRQATEEMG